MLAGLKLVGSEDAHLCDSLLTPAIGRSQNQRRKTSLIGGAAWGAEAR